MLEILTRVFVFAEDFCKELEPHWNKLRLESKEEKSSDRKTVLFLSKML